MGAFHAILPGAGLSRHARDLRRVHHAVLSGGRAPLRPRAVVERSWARVLRAGLHPDRALWTESVRAEISRLRRAIGALVATNPYRLADGVVLEMAG